MSTAGSQYNYDYAPVIDLHPSWRTHVHNDADSGRATTICAFDASTGRLGTYLAIRPFRPEHRYKWDKFLLCPAGSDG